MENDPILAELRQVRRDLDTRYPGVQCYFEHLCRYQKRLQSRLVRRAPLPALVRAVPTKAKRSRLVSVRPAVHGGP